MRNKTKILKTRFLTPLPSSWDQLCSQILYLLPPRSAGGWGMGVAVSSSQVVSATPSSSHSSCSSMGSLPQETVFHELLQCESFPQAAALHELLQRGSFPRGADLQEQAAPVWVPHGVTSPASKPAPTWAPLSTGPQVLAEACSSTGSPQGHSFLQASTCSSVGSLPRGAGGYLLHHGPPSAAGGHPASPWSSPCTVGESLLQHLEHLLPLLLHCPWCLQSCFSHTVSLPSIRCCCSTPGFPSLLKYIIPEVLPPLLMGSALASSGSILELAGIGSVRHRGSFCRFSKQPPCSPLPLPKPCHANRIHIQIKLGKSIM